jgi:cysteine-rich repeat protein
MARSRILAALGTPFLLSASAAPAAPADHLQCRKIKDSAAKAAYTATLTPDNPIFAEAAGCTIKTPAKLLCTSVARTSISPLPPGAADGEPSATFLCYSAKCPAVTTSASTSDVFGPHTLEASVTKPVCAPIETTGCRDGVIVGSEECDDGDLANGDGCDVNCTSTRCGNAIIVGSEECDDDGCSDSCVVDPGFTCSGEPSMCAPL